MWEICTLGENYNRKGCSSRNDRSGCCLYVDVSHRVRKGGENRASLTLSCLSFKLINELHRHNCVKQIYSTYSYIPHGYIDHNSKPCRPYVLCIARFCRNSNLAYDALVYTSLIDVTSFDVNLTLPDYSHRSARAWCRPVPLFKCYTARETSLHAAHTKYLRRLLWGSGPG